MKKPVFMALTIGGALAVGAALDHGWQAATTPDAGICAGDLARQPVLPASRVAPIEKIAPSVGAPGLAIAPFAAATRPTAVRTSLSAPTADAARPGDRAHAATSDIFDPRSLLWGAGLLGLLGLGFVFRRAQRKEEPAALYPASALATGAAFAPDTLYEHPATAIDPWASNGWETGSAPAAHYAQTPAAADPDPSIVWEDAAGPVAGLSPLAAWDKAPARDDRPGVESAEFDAFQPAPEDDTWSDLRRRRTSGSGRRKLILAGVVLGGITALAATANRMEFANATASGSRKVAALAHVTLPATPASADQLVQARPGTGTTFSHHTAPGLFGTTTHPAGRVGPNRGQAGGALSDNPPGDPGAESGPNVAARQFDALGAGDKVVWDQGRHGTNGQISPSQGGGGGSGLPLAGSPGSGMPQSGASTSSGGDIFAGDGSTSGGSTSGGSTGAGTTSGGSSSGGSSGNGGATGTSSSGGLASGGGSTSGGASSGGGSSSGGSHPGDLIGTDDSGSTGAVDVPEPGTLGLLGAGVVALAVSRSRRFRRPKA